jgi:hypothetical protein
MAYDQAPNACLYQHGMTFNSRVARGFRRRSLGSSDDDNDPPAGAYHAMTYDSAREQIVLFGGWDGAIRLTERPGLEQENLDANQTGSTPPPRRGGDMVYDGRDADLSCSVAKTEWQQQRDVGLGCTEWQERHRFIRRAPASTKWPRRRPAASGAVRRRIQDSAGVNF